MIRQQRAAVNLTRPFDIEELWVRIDNLIRLRQRLRERFSSPPISIRAQDVEVTSMDRRFTDDVQAVIESQLADDDFSVGRLANAVGLSRAHLYRRLQELTGESPSTLVRSVRLERVAQLLEQEAGSVSEIAYGVGFKSVSHFSRIFGSSMDTSHRRTLWIHLPNKVRPGGGQAKIDEAGFEKGTQAAPSRKKLQWFLQHGPK